MIPLWFIKIINLFALNHMSYLKAQIIELDSVDSTNNYAMRLIDGNTAQPGMTIVAGSQTGGKGQRGKAWADKPGESLLMSMIIAPVHTLNCQFLFNAAVAVAIANVLRKLHTGWDVAIKWPNDIIINDKKAGGILIENVLRGSTWAYSIVGFGLNVRQAGFSADLPFAISLKIASGLEFDMQALRQAICSEVIAATSVPLPENGQMQLYNSYLYRQGMLQAFTDGPDTWYATILNAMPDGTLQVQLEYGMIVNYTHGQVAWVYA